MGCCGDKKQTIQRPGPGVRVTYTGGIATNIRGSFTGRIYGFASPGQTIAVDSRDLPGLIRMPHIKLYVEPEKV